MQSRDLKQVLITGLKQLIPQTSESDTKRLKNIITVLSKASIADDDYFRVAVFIFLLFAEMPSVTKRSQLLRELFLACNDFLTAPPIKPTPQ